MARQREDLGKTAYGYLCPVRKWHVSGALKSRAVLHVNRRPFIRYEQGLLLVTAAGNLRQPIKIGSIHRWSYLRPIGEGQCTVIAPGSSDSNPRV